MKKKEGMKHRILEHLNNCDEPRCVHQMENYLKIDKKTLSIVIAPLKKDGKMETIRHDICERLNKPHMFYGIPGRHSNTPIPSVFDEPAPATLKKVRPVLRKPHDGGSEFREYKKETEKEIAYYKDRIRQQNEIKDQLNEEIDNLRRKLHKLISLLIEI